MKRRTKRTSLRKNPFQYLATVESASRLTNEKTAAINNRMDELLPRSENTIVGKEQTSAPYSTCGGGGYYGDGSGYWYRI